MPPRIYSAIDIAVPAWLSLRHAVCIYHFAFYSNENLTAAQAGNSPAIIHANYKSLATKADAEKWFQVAPNRIPTT
jgi:hypothetical protein